MDTEKKSGRPGYHRVSLTATQMLDLAAARGREVRRWMTNGYGETGVWFSRAGRPIAASNIVYWDRRPHVYRTGGGMITLSA